MVATGFAPTQASLQPMLRGMATVGREARTLRMLGSAAIMLAWVACGRLSAYFEADLNSWDSAAGVLLCYTHYDSTYYDSTYYDLYLP